MADLLKLESDDGEVLEAEIRHGQMIVKVEMADFEGAPGDIVRVHFLPAKAQARSLGEMLLRWAKGDGEF